MADPRPACGERVDMLGSLLRLTLCAPGTVSKDLERGLEQSMGPSNLGSSAGPQHATMCVEISRLALIAGFKAIITLN